MFSSNDRNVLEETKPRPSSANDARQHHHGYEMDTSIDEDDRLTFDNLVAEVASDLVDKTEPFYQQSVTGRDAKSSMKVDTTFNAGSPGPRAVAINSSG